MAKRLHNVRRRAAFAAATILLASVGCAFPHGSTAGDPLLGNFNRPIVPTPPPERGGLGLDSPAYDAGARIGMTPPEVATPIENSSGFQTLPNLTSGNLFSNARTPFGTPNDAPVTRRPSTFNGARLPSVTDTGMRLPGVPYQSQSRSDGVMARPRDPVASFTSGSSFNATEPATPIQLASFEAPRDPSHIETIDDAHAHMQSLGARSQRTEELSTGEWFYTCSVNQKVYESRGRDQFEAMRKAAMQIRRDR
jgi:hypothetical protein